MRRIQSITRSATFALLAAATLTVLALGWVVARDLRRSADAAGQLYERFGEGLDIIDDILFETGEVRRILLYALHTTDANRQLDYVDQSRSAEGRVRQLLDSRSPILSTARTRAARESVAAAWTDYLQTRDEVVGLILEGSLTEAVSLDERIGAARFNRVRSAKRAGCARTDGGQAGPRADGRHPGEPGRLREQACSRRRQAPPGRMKVSPRSPSRATRCRSSRTR